MRDSREKGAGMRDQDLPFQTLSLVLDVKRLCVVVDSRISAAKVCDCVRFPHGVDRQNSVGYVV